jgi:hypothetical protein
VANEDHTVCVHHERVFCSGLLSVSTTFRLVVSGETDHRHIDRIIRMLKVQKEIMEEADAEAPCAAEAPEREDEAAQRRQVQGEPQEPERPDGVIDGQSQS